MAITISNLTVSNNVPTGTTIGVITTIDASGAVIPCNYRLTKGSIGYFVIAGDELVTAWSMPATPGSYSVRVRAIGSSTIFSGSATFTVAVGIAAPPPPPPSPPPATSIVVNGSSNAVVTQGAALAIAVANGPGNTTDWVGLAAAGTPDSSYISWYYLDGTQSAPAVGLTAATVMMTAPAANGAYEARFYPNNGYTATARASFTVASPAPAPPPPPSPPATSIVVNGSSNAVVTQGAALAIAVANGPGNTTDWVGLAAAGTPDSSYISWYYLDGTQSAPAVGLTAATVMMTAPAANGAYEARFYPNNGYTATARASFTVASPAPAPPPPPSPPATSIVVNGSSNAVVTQGAALAIAVANGPGNTTDWVGLAAAGTPDSSYISWYYLDGTQSAPAVGLTAATVMMTAPAANGAYEARFYPNNGYTATARASFTVASPAPAPPPPPSPPATSIVVNGSSNAVVTQGAALAIAVANGPGNTTDWVGLAAAGTPDSSYISWYYLDGTQSAPAVGLTAATVMMTAPAANGAYEARLYPNNGYTATARASFTVASPAPAPPPPPSPPATSIVVNGSSNAVVTQGAALAIAVANGPGNTTDWVGLAAAGTPDSSYISWYYLDGTQSAPAVGLTAATVMMTAPAANGAYEARFYPNNGYTATARASFTVASPAPAPPPPPSPAAVITVTPNSPQMPDTTPVGAVVATYTVTMSDGSPFVGTIGFGPPNFDASGIFSLTGSPTSGNIIVNPSGPGIGPNSSTITDQITLVATQP